MQNIDNTNADKLTMNYVLEQMEKIAQQTEYLMEAIEKLGQMLPASGPGDVAGQAKAEALARIVKHREATNQRLIKFYEKLYEDLMRGEAERL